MIVPQKVPLPTLTNYSILLDKLLESEAIRDNSGLGDGAVSSVSVSVKGRKYWYLQKRTGHTRKRVYVGPDTEETRNRISNILEAEKHVERNSVVIDNLVAMLSAVKIARTKSDEQKVLRGLHKSGIFSAGGILAGTMAFRLYPFLTGYDVVAREPYATLDIDHSYNRKIDVFIDRDRGDPQEILKNIPLIGTPTRDPKHGSYQFPIKGTDLTLDILTTLDPKEDRPEDIKSVNEIGFMAKPLEFMDYLAKEPVRAAIPDMGILVNIPSPSRYMIHKIVISTQRQNDPKKIKDGLQAEVLASVIPKENMILAMKDFFKMYGSKGKSIFDSGLGNLDENSREIMKWVVKNSRVISPRPR